MSLTNLTILTMDELIDTRAEKLCDIAQAKYEQEEIETEVKKQLIAFKQTEYLSVNWKQLTQQYR